MNNYKFQLAQELITLLENQIMDLTLMSKIELGDDVIAEISRLKSLINSKVTLKQTITNNFIYAFKDVFDAYPTLQSLPVFAWGRYYKYECAGSQFTCDVYNGFTNLSKLFNSRDQAQFDSELLNLIDKTHNVPGGKLWTCEWGDYSPDVDDIIKEWDFDDRGGRCLVIFRNGNDLDLTCISCDSPE